MGDSRGLDVTLFPDLDAYVKALQGTTVIRKILIANNGIAAVKAIRFLRKWSYEVFGNEREVCPCASCETIACKRCCCIGHCFSIVEPRHTSIDHPAHLSLQHSLIWFVFAPMAVADELVIFCLRFVRRCFLARDASEPRCLVLLQPHLRCASSHVVVVLLLLSNTCELHAR